MKLLVDHNEAMHTLACWQGRIAAVLNSANHLFSHVHQPVIDHVAKRSRGLVQTASPSAASILGAAIIVARDDEKQMWIEIGRDRKDSS